MALPSEPILAGPILRRVEPNLVAVWVALQRKSTVKLSLWENQIAASDAKDGNLWFRSPDPGATTVRLGDNLHVVVVTLRLPSGKTLVPERLYSYDLEITDAKTAKQTLGSLGLLRDNPANTDPDGDNTRHLALGYEPNLLPCLVLPPNELTDLKIVHGSCRDVDMDLPDGLAWLDDLLSGDKAYRSALKRPHQLFLTGDQIYSDEVSRPLLHLLNGTAQDLFGALEQLPFKSAQEPHAAPANLTNFPVGWRHNLVLNEAGMSTSNAHNHLLSFGEFCAMYLYVWSNVCWGDKLAALPKADQLPPEHAEDAITPPALRDAITKNPNIPSSELRPEDEALSYAADVARLVEFHRTLPKVRRALANVPSYMIFDDHEVSDDWYLNPTWRDRVLDSPLGNAIVRNGMLAYALFQGWGNDPVKFEPRAGLTEQQPHEQLLAEVPNFVPAQPPSGLDAEAKKMAEAKAAADAAAAARKIEHFLGLDLRNKQALDGSWAETDPPLKWFYTVPGTKHQVLVLDCRTRRAYASRISPPGNIGLTAQAEQIPALPQPADKQVWIVVSSLPVLGPPVFDALLAPTIFRAFDFKDSSILQPKAASLLQNNRGTKGIPGTNPDAVEAWAFDSKLFEALIKRLEPYSPVLILSGDVHYSACNAMSYWSNKPEPARLVQFISSGFKNVMPAMIVNISRSFAFAQKMIRSNVGAEQLAWTSSSPSPVTVPADAKASARLQSLLRKSPVMIPSIGWPKKTTTTRAPDWAWRVSPISDTRPEKDRPKMARPATLFPDAPSRKNDDVSHIDIEGYQRVAERHARGLDRINNCRQILFASAIAVITFQKRTKLDKAQKSTEVIYAIQDLYTVQRDPEDLVGRPKPLIYTRHEVALRDVWQDRPSIPPPKPNP